jgi:hypothetical protein
MKDWMNSHRRTPQNTEKSLIPSFLSVPSERCGG